ncbi:hypothetical protein [Nonomuraea bangladeshensis]|uniref:hypothetical protein n=1 Tax=Nonomuraea bangladeshensis TaxID=404385 RepID=UPI0031D99BB1
MENTETTCTSCKTPLRNQAEDGRPDVWKHTTATNPPCFTAMPPYQVEEALPREIRKVRIRVEELVAYEREMKLSVHVGVTADELAAYLTDNTEAWADDIEEHFFTAENREVVSGHTFFADDAGYLENLASYLETASQHLKKWLTITCPVCGVLPAADDTLHQNVGWVVGIACSGARLVHPGWIGMDGTNWTDWTELQLPHASGKARD